MGRFLITHKALLALTRFCAGVRTLPRESVLQSAVKLISETNYFSVTKYAISLHIIKFSVYPLENYDPATGTC